MRFEAKHRMAKLVAASSCEYMVHLISLSERFSSAQPWRYMWLIIIPLAYLILQYTVSSL